MQVAIFPVFCDKILKKHVKCDKMSKKGGVLYGTITA
nr:MAG TPA: hypothetical protein [Caudoviricetes sp.]